MDLQKIPVHKAVASVPKRALDIAGAACGFILTLPLFVFAAVSILVTMGRPVFFRMQRPGHREQPFSLLKFRTMRAPKPGEIWFRSDADRLTPLGKFLRKSSLDELPQLLNVLKGDMSLVGPRPLLMEYLPHFSEHHRKRHNVRPGITGLAQVSGRNSLKLSERRSLDVEYVDNWSFFLDLKILFRTVFQVVHGKGVISGRTMAEVDDLGLEKALLKGKEDRTG